MEPTGIEEKIKTLSGTLTILIEEMNEKLNKFRLEFSKALNEIQELKKETEEIKVQMKGVKTLEWESRNKNIIIFGLKDFENESKLETLNRVIKLFTDALKINIEKQQIDNIYWIGKRKPNRPLLIKFNNTITKDFIIRQKRIFGKWKVRVEEDFSPEIRNIRKRLVEYMWRERKNGKHAILSNDKILVNGVPFDLQFYERNHPLERANLETKENENSKYSLEGLNMIKDELNKLKHSIGSLRVDNNSFTKMIVTEAGENQTIRYEDHTHKKSKEDPKRILKFDSNWTLAAIKTPENSDQEVEERGNCNINREHTRRAKSAVVYNKQEDNKTRPAGTELSRTPREDKESKHSKNNYFLRNRPKPTTHQRRDNNPHLK